MPANGSARPPAEPPPRPTRSVEIATGISIGGGAPLLFIGGPCVIESEAHALKMARALAGICRGLDLPFVFKASYDKANRSSVESFRGPGLVDGLRILKTIKDEVKVPVLSDIHDPSQAEPAAEVLDILQIPAFLCRQTDLLTAAGRTGRPVNIKKGQFISPWDIRHAVDKVAATGNDKVLLTERGTSFGYRNLVVDYRSLVIMREHGYPVVMDATHAVQLPGSQGDRSGGDARYIPHLARAAAAVGIDALFLEVHDNPAAALSDGPNALPLDKAGAVLDSVRSIDALLRGL
jgi:2-dehydro-3-deoxyphosphooctonate aldolase (KDO 8-P synthase)